MESEIDFLLGYIETSGCTFTRNGEDHDSQEAAKHIRRKYAHTKKWIKTAEDFIRLTATKSSISGEPYMVTCGGEMIPTSTWLNQALVRFREKGIP